MMETDDFKRLVEVHWCNRCGEGKVEYSPEHDNYYCSLCKAGQGQVFYLHRKIDTLLASNRALNERIEKAMKDAASMLRSGERDKKINPLHIPCFNPYLMALKDIYNVLAADDAAQRKG